MSPLLRLALVLPPLLLGACSPPTANAESGTTETESQGEAPPPLVRVGPLERRTVRRSIRTTSYLESEHRVPIMPEIGGRVVEVLVDDSQKVKKDELLARLDDREAQTAVKQVEVQIAERKVQLELMKLDIDAKQARVLQARAERDKAKNLHERNLQIDPELISERELDDSRFALAAAVEALRVAEFDSKKAELTVQSSQANIEELQARLEAEQLKLADHEIRSPIDGEIESRMIRGGETVGTTSELFVVVDRHNLVAYLRRPQREFPILRNAKEVKFTTEAYSDHEFGAKIDAISPVVDQTSGSFDLRIRVDRGDELAAMLRPGMFIRAEINTEEQRKALMVPKRAVLNEGARSVVFVVRDNVAHRVVLDVGVEERDFIECLNQGEGGLSDEDRVVIAGQHSLQDKSAVEIAQDNEPK